jgi:hypothetical protein
MPVTDTDGGILDWLVPAAVVFGSAALLVLVAVWAVKRARRSPRARAAAEQVRARAGVQLVRLDDAVDELDLEVALSGALYGGTAPASLRRARMTAQHVRDESFDEYRGLSRPGLHPAELRRGAVRIERRTDEALGRIAAAREEHAAWVAANISAVDQVAAARGHLERLRAEMGDPAALIADLSARFDEAEWADAARAARGARDAAASAEDILSQAAAHAGDPTRSVLTELAEAERALRRAEADARILEETHRLVTQAAQALPGEFDAARSALRHAQTVRSHLPPAEAERLGGELRALSADLDGLEPRAARRPTKTIDEIARVRDRLDMALGDAHTAQQRLRGARTALPGTLAAARAAVAQAEGAIAHSGGGADARARLLSAQRELAAARQAQDPVDALDAARRAMREAEDAKALADYSRLAGGTR